MSIRLKSLLILVFAFALLAVTNAFIQRVLIYPSIAKLEQTEAERDLTRCRETLTNAGEELAHLSIDWASWDDAYEFMQDHNAEFIRSNLPPDTFSNTRVNAICFYDTAGKLVFGAAYPDLAADPLVPDPASPLLHLPPDDNLLAPDTAVEGINGVRILEGVPYVIAALPSLHADGSGPRRGTVIFARMLDPEMVKRIAKQAQVALSVVALVEGSTPPEIQDAFSRITASAPFFLDRRDRQAIQGYVAYPGIDGQPALVLNAVIPRVFMSQGQAAARLAQTSLLLALLLMLIITGLLLERTVLARLAHLNAFVCRVSAQQDLSQRHIVLAKDEIGQLATEINAMLAKLETAANELSAALDAAKAGAIAKSEFLSTMSHEIRTPMNGIIGMTGLLLDMGLDGQQREFVETVKMSADALLSIVNDILDCSKAEAGRMVLESIDFDLRHVIESTAELLATRAQDKGVELVSQIMPEVPVLVRGDPGRLRQVLMNLIGNAVKFTEQGEIVIKAEIESLDTADDQVTIRFSVSDTGIGIPPDKLDRLFQQFSQVDASTTRKFGGTGLGLAISKQLVELAGGVVGVNSELGVGSTFWFCLPLKLQEAIDHFIPAAPEELHGMRVLVVDDNLTNRTILAKQLTSWEMDADIAESGTQALAMLEHAASAGNAYQLALLDYHMPDLNGSEVAQRITADPAIAKTQLVLLTSSGQQGDAARMRELGFSAYLVKPIKQSVLLDCLQAVVGVSKSDPKLKESLLVTRHTLKEAQFRHCRVLVAEDNPVNQKVAFNILTRGGYSVMMVSTGRQAVDHVRSGRCDIVLMDCQMPELDGFEATEEIRRLDGPVARIPIVAMTAHAMPGDRQRCLDVGMDGYVSKPINPQELFAVMDDVLHSHALKLDPSSPQLETNAIAAGLSPDSLVQRPGSRTAPEAPHPEPLDVQPNPPMNIEASIERAGDREFWQLLMTTYLEETDKCLGSLAAALRAGAAETVQREAHSIKGASAEIMAEGVRNAAFELEMAGRTGSLAGGPVLLAVLQEQYARLKAYLVEGGETFKP